MRTSCGAEMSGTVTGCPTFEASGARYEGCGGACQAYACIHAHLSHRCCSRTLACTLKEFL